MNKHHTIQVFEHQRLRVGEQGFKQKHLNALGKLNELHQGAYFEMIAQGVRFNQYVGVIQTDGLIIEIHPKADRYGETERWRGVLLQMLQSCGRLKPSSAGAAHVSRQNLNLLDVYFELFLGELDHLMRLGLVKRYRKQTKNTTALKGKLEFAGNIRNNLVHKERFYTTHQVYDANHLLHQVLAAALDIVADYTKGTVLYDKCKRVQLNFPEVTQTRITKAQLDSLKLNRKTKSYAYALELARLIILNYSPDIKGGQERMLSLLFDMNELWEEYVLVQLKKYVTQRKLPIEVTGQESKSFWGSNSLRPDIVLKHNDTTLVLDTKWKLPNNRSASVADLRQMYTYNRFWDAKKALLLYPGLEQNESFQEFQTTEYLPNADAYQHECKLGFIEVVDSEGILLDVGKSVFSLLQFDELNSSF